MSSDPRSPSRASPQANRLGLRAILRPQKRIRRLRRQTGLSIYLPHNFGPKIDARADANYPRRDEVYAELVRSLKRTQVQNAGVPLLKDADEQPTPGSSRSRLSERRCRRDCEGLAGSSRSTAGLDSRPSTRTTGYSSSG